MGFLKSQTARLGQFLALYGGWGLLGISFFDSSFVPLPGLNDLLLLHLCGQHPERAILYALATTTGSVLGCYVMFGLARGGARFLWRGQRSASLARAHQWLEKNEFATLLVASLLPPPAPFKAFLLAAGALRVNAWRFGLALMVGRSLRFGTEAFLGARYGAAAEAYLKANFVPASLAIVLAVIAATFLYRRLVGRGASSPGVTSGDSPSPGEP